MNGLLEYYLIGGNLRIGKKEMTLELLRKDSILRVLLGFEAGNPFSLMASGSLSAQADVIEVNFNERDKIMLGDDPEPMLNELKKRYGSVGGRLTFLCVYTTFEQTFYFHADLDQDTIVLE